MTLLARLRAPARARRDEIITVALVLAHPMENGMRYTDDGQQIPSNVIEVLSCHYLGELVWQARLGPGVAANPFFQFSVRARATGELRLNWSDQRGERGELRHALVVEG